MDSEAHHVRGKGTGVSTAHARVKVLLIPTEEELLIAMYTAEIVGKYDLTTAPPGAGTSSGRRFFIFSRLRRVVVCLPPQPGSSMQGSR